MFEWFHKKLPLLTQLKLTVYMTFFDLFMTLTWVYSGNATEANPILRHVLDKGPLSFSLAKLALALGGIWIFYKNQAHKLVRSTVPFIFCSYVCLTLFHFAGLAFYLSYF